MRNGPTSGKRPLCADPRCNRPASSRFSFALAFKLLTGEAMTAEFCSASHRDRMRPWFAERRMLAQEPANEDESR